ncbi:MAG TPA: hypothetical protein VFS89_07010 [Nitrosospira sp.]|nr:hypothetical protein [Nitrosospira sp.]
MDLNETPVNCHLRKLLAGMAIVLAMCSHSTASAASPLLRCEISQGGEAYIVDFLPRIDPYTVEAKNINGKFRFKAIVLGNEKLVESVKIYTYYQEQHQMVLLHEAKYMPPFSQSPSSPAALTGVNYLYSPRLEEELQYGCALLEVDL